jgi:hypothetical protein
MHHFSWLTINSVAALATVVNGLVVIVLKSTQIMAKAAEEQSDASRQQAASAARTLDLLLLERKDTDNYQRAVFQSECRDLTGELRRLESVVNLQAKPFRERDVYLMPTQWDVCRTYITRQAPDMLPAMLALEANLPNDSAAIMGVIRAPDSQWIATVQRRADIATRLRKRREEVEAFHRDVIAAADVSRDARK